MLHKIQPSLLPECSVTVKSRRVTVMLSYVFFFLQTKNAKTSVPRFEYNNK